MAHKFDKLPKDLKDRMADVVWAFEPERLTCDGEIRGAQLDARVDQLSKEWWTLVAEARQKGLFLTIDFDEFQEYLYQEILSR